MKCILSEIIWLAQYSRKIAVDAPSGRLLRISRGRRHYPPAKEGAMPREENRPFVLEDTRACEGIVVRMKEGMVVRAMEGSAKGDDDRGAWWCDAW